jgi:hypothetical protein
MDISKKDHADRVWDAVKRITEKTINWHTQNNNMVFARVAIVKSYNSSTKMATVYFAGDDPNNTTVLKNRSGETLSADNEVYVFCIGSLTNAYVAVKK